MVGGLEPSRGGRGGARADRVWQRGRGAGGPPRAHVRRHADGRGVRDRAGADEGAAPRRLRAAPRRRDLDALLGLPLDSVAVRTTLGIAGARRSAAPSGVACRYTRAGGRPGRPLLDVTSPPTPTPDAAAEQWRTNVDVEDGAHREVPIGSAGGGARRAAGEARAAGRVRPEQRSPWSCPTSRCPAAARRRHARRPRAAGAAGGRRRRGTAADGHRRPGRRRRHRSRLTPRRPG